MVDLRPLGQSDEGSRVDDNVSGRKKARDKTLNDVTNKLEPGQLSSTLMDWVQAPNRMHYGVGKSSMGLAGS